MENSAEQNKGTVAQAFKAALPIMLGYVFLGLPCGILSQQIGLSPLQVFLLCALFYSGAGQYMIPNMWLAQSPIFAIIASVTLVNTRQLLYATSLSRYTENSSKRAAVVSYFRVRDAPQDRHRHLCEPEPVFPFLTILEPQTAQRTAFIPISFRRQI